MRNYDIISSCNFKRDISNMFDLLSYLEKLLV